MLKISPPVLLIPVTLIAFASSGYGWPSNIPKPDDETVATKVDWIWNNVVKKTVMGGGGRGTYTNFIDQLHASAAMGKFLLSSLQCEGDKTALSLRFARGIFLIRIKCDNHNEVHRVNIFY
ncbi:MAG: hypothetical protein JW863_20095 [Chitinispirillaceae bacterium]|nr:hypothetical protein [Chitinispirillaceae bacterium]